MPTVLARPPWAVVALALASVGAAALVVGLGASGWPAADLLGMCAEGALATSAGLLAVRSARRARDTARTLLAGSLATLGAGSLVLVGQAALAGGDVDRLPVPSAGDWFSTAAVPLAVAGVLLLPALAHPLERTRTGLDAALVTTAACLAVWEVWFRSSLPAGLVPAALPSAVLIVLSLGILSLMVVTAVRDLHVGLAVCAAGMVAHVGSDVSALLGAADDRGFVSSAVSCVGLTVAALGVTMGAGPGPGGAGRRQHATTLMRTTTSALTAGMMLLYLAAVMLHGTEGLTAGEQRVPVALVGVLLLVNVARDSVRAQHVEDLLGELGRLAATDPLTGLGNRRALTDALEDRAGDERGLGLVTMDLDGFKDVNRLLGHGTGDTLLQRVGAAMEQALRDRDARAFRLGGDEFAVLVEGGECEATAVADHLLEVTRCLVQDIPGVGRVALSASIGVACVPPASGGPDDAVQALALSGEAMRASKALGRGRVTAYTDRMAQEARRRSAVERRLREVIAKGGTEVHYQPVMHVPTGTVVGIEALARWHDDELGPVPPLEFIGIAENTGLMPELGLQLLRSALHGFVASGACSRGVTMGVNLSTLQLRMPGFAGTVVSMAKACGVPYRQLVAEVTESVLLEDGDPAVAAVYELAAAGIPIALDDFGTGYSSLAYLHRLPVAVLKIDRVMTLSMETPRGMAITRSVAGMGAALGIDVVVEGVETSVQAGLVADLGIPYAQGWLYASSMTPADLRTFLDGRTTLAELDGATRVAEPLTGAAGP